MGGASREYRDIENFAYGARRTDVASHPTFRRNARPVAHDCCEGGLREVPGAYCVVDRLDGDSAGAVSRSRGAAAGRDRCG